MKAYILDDNGVVLNVIEVESEESAAEFGAVLNDKFAPKGYRITENGVLDPDGNPAYRDEMAEDARRVRDEGLANTDWMVTKYLEKGEPVPQALIDFRQRLRDITKDDGFPTFVNWPMPPEL
jgi:hypothetical protein